MEKAACKRGEESEKGAEKTKGDNKETTNPGAARHGNFINYYEFHPPEERLRLLPEDLAKLVAPRKGPVLLLDVGCNAGVSTRVTTLLVAES